MSWKIGAVVTAALLLPVQRPVVHEAPKPAPAIVPPIAAAPALVIPTNPIQPLETWSSARDARAIAADDAHVWIATGGGLDRYTRATRERRHFGVQDGLDTLDVRSVESTSAGIVARTGTSRCALSRGERFLCSLAKAAPAKAENLALLQGYPISASLRVGSDTYVATRGGGAFFAPAGDSSKAVALTSASKEPASFVHAGAVFGNALWLGTFDDGLYRVPLDPQGRPTGALAQTARSVKSPARLVNRLVATTGKNSALYVGASEGLFVTRDGATFTRVNAIAPHAITGLAATPTHLWVSSTEALYRLALDGQGPVQRSFVRPGGSHAIQAVTVSDDGVAWLATEDRGVVRVDNDGSIHTYDRVAGLPSSWFVAVDTDGAGGVIATSLRHGAVHLGRDGAWSKLDWAPSPWGLGVRRDSLRTCLATQGGATCETKDGTHESLALLPDPRVHVFLPLGNGTLVGTEAGVAVYPL
jgi:hypothetical protein